MRRNGFYSMIKECGFTPAKLAATINVSRGIISHWIKGRRRPSVKHVIAVADALGRTPGEVLACFE